VLAPSGAGLYGSLDRSLGHKRRYTRDTARELVEGCGFQVEKIYTFNRAGAPQWWAYSKVFSSTKINKPVLKLFDKTVWLWRRMDRALPWPGLSLIMIARNQQAASMEAETVRETSSRNAS
jgi:hypothetical protein